MTKVLFWLNDNATQSKSDKNNMTLNQSSFSFQHLFFSQLKYLHLFPLNTTICEPIQRCPFKWKQPSGTSINAYWLHCLADHIVFTMRICLISEQPHCFHFQYIHLISDFTLVLCRAQFSIQFQLHFQFALHFIKLYKLRAVKCRAAQSTTIRRRSSI